MSKLQVSIHKGAASKGIRISREEANEIADHLESGYVIIPMSELPRVEEGPHDNYVRTVASGGTYESAFHDHAGAPACNPEWHRNHARHHLAMACWLEANRNSARNRRRAELAAELWPHAAGRADETYDNLSRGMRDAIDRIIDLESAA